MERRDTTWIVAFLVLGAVGLWAFLNNYDRAIPVASLDFKLSRDEAFLEAQEFAVSRGHDLLAFDNAQIFAPDMMSQIFLQKSVGLEETNRLARDWISLYRWQVRWYRPLEKEEIHVHLDPGGRVVRYDHRILDEDEGANLTESEAQAIAEGFVFDANRFERSDWEEVEQSSEERAARTDHTFTYRKNGFTVGDDGHYRARVVVQGDRVGKFSEFVFVPETFKRSFSETRSKASLLTSVFTLFWIALGISVLVLLAQRYRAGGLQWRSSTILGIGVLIAMMLAQLNSIPLIAYNYTTTQSVGSFYIIIVMSVVMTSVFTGGLVSMTGTAGAWITRDVFGSTDLFPRLSFHNLLSGRYVRATLIGYGLAGLMLGFLILFYYVGTELFGVWSPAYVIEYDNAFSTAFPWAYPLLIGLVAAAQEEFFFRLLAISLLLRWLKIRWIAVLVPAIVWGFLHSNYPVEPIYTRGIELTIVGVGFGMVFLRWGIWSTIVAHYAYNAFVTAFPMLRSSSLYFQISGIAVIGLLCVPVLIAAISAIRRQPGAQIEDEEDEVQEAATPVPRPTEAERQVTTSSVASLDSYVMSSRNRLITLVAIVVGAAIYYTVDVPRFGKEGYETTVDRAAAITKADSVLAALEWSLPDAHQYATYSDALGSDHFAYLVREVGVVKADSLVAASLHPRIWRVRWFKPLEKTEYRIAVSSTGDLASLRRVLPDSLPGASLESDIARPIAEAGLAAHLAVNVTDTSAFKLIESKSDKREDRLDHRFVWERLGSKVGEAEFRVNATVQGDSFGAASYTFKAPEQFLRDFREKGTKDAVLQVIQVGVMIGFVIFGSVFFFRFYRQGQITWKGPIIVGCTFLAAMLIENINGLPQFYQGFNTSQAMSTFLGGEAIKLVVALSLGPAFFAVLAALALALHRDQIPDHADPIAALDSLRSGEGRGLLLLDSCLGAIAFSMLSRAGSSLRVYVKHTYFLQYGDTSSHSLPWMEGYLPAAEGIAGIIQGFSFIFLAMVAVLILKRVLKKWEWVFVFGVLMGCFQQLGMAKDLTHGIVIVSITAVAGVISYGYVFKVLRFNILAYFVGMVFLTRAWSGIRVMDSEMMWYAGNGFVVVAVALLPLWVGLYRAVKDR